jgi:hypothetical protein
MRRKLLVVSMFLSCAILFSLFTVFYQVAELGRSYLLTDQLARHRLIVQGTAGNPFQYRILSEYLVEGLIRTFTSLGISQPITSAFILFRIIQNTVIFLLASLYYKKLGLNPYVTLIGLSLLAFGMTQSLYNSDLAFSTYSDIIFYLAAGLVILHNRAAWIIPIVGLAALNRETSGLIPFMLVLHCLYIKPDKNALKRDIVIGTVALGLYTFVFFSLRYIYGVERRLMSPQGIHLGVEFLSHNFFNYMTYVQLFATLGILPMLAIFAARQWPRSLHAFFWAIVPIWLFLHPFMSSLFESRLLLVPFILIFVPGALFGIEGIKTTQSASWSN